MASTFFMAMTACLHHLLWKFPILRCFVFRPLMSSWYSSNGINSLLVSKLNLWRKGVVYCCWKRDALASKFRSMCLISSTLAWAWACSAAPGATWSHACWDGPRCVKSSMASSISVAFWLYLLSFSRISSLLSSWLRKSTYPPSRSEFHLSTEDQALSGICIPYLVLFLG